MFCCFSACHKDIYQTHSSEYFPNTVGDYWEYEVYDSSQVREHPSYPRRYSVKVIITGTTKLVDGKDATVWQYEYPWGSVINYIRIVGDTIKEFDTVYSRDIRGLDFPRKIFIQPFNVNKRWDGKLLAIDSSRVINQRNVIIGSQSFSDCFDIYHHYVGPNMDFNDQYWFKPNLGMVQIFYNHYNLGFFRIELWQLKKYYIR